MGWPETETFRTFLRFYRKKSLPHVANWIRSVILGMRMSCSSQILSQAKKGDFNAKATKHHQIGSSKVNLRIAKLLPTA